MTFETLGLSDVLLRAIKTSGYTSPTPIQAQAIPAILKGADIMAAAQTGTGKTAGFTLPMLQLLGENKEKKGKVRALILTPTRELAAQVQESVNTYGRHSHLRSTVVYGGVNIYPQIKKLRNGVEILVATPGRLMDLYRQKAFNFNEVEMFILDEADRMLDMGFIDDIKTVMKLLPKKRQTLMFSATFSEEIRQLAKGITNDPVEIDVAPRNSTVEIITQKVHPVDKSRKAELLSHLIRNSNWDQVLVFCRTKHGADKLVKRLSRDNIQTAAIHGDKSQSQRTRTLLAFKKNKVQVLVATDIAARGLDINQLSHVVNIDMPYNSQDYIHRIGRTGRAGASGNAVSLVSADEAKQLQSVERLIGRKIDREEIDNFEPSHAIPEHKANKPGNSKKGKRRPAHRGQKQEATGDRPARRNKSKRKPTNNHNAAPAAKRSRRSKPSQKAS